MERKKSEITKVLYNNHNTNHISNINIKHYRQLQKISNERKKISSPHTRLQRKSNEIPPEFKIIDMGIHNLSNQNFTGHELYLLSLGLKFKLPFLQAHNDCFILNCFEEYCNRLRKIKIAKLTNTNNTNLSLCSKLTMLITKLHNKHTHCDNKHPLATTHGILLENYIKTSRHNLTKLLLKNNKNKYGHNMSHLYLTKLYRSVNEVHLTIGQNWVSDRIVC
jgi:hypothetical protein